MQIETAEAEAMNCYVHLHKVMLNFVYSSTVHWFQVAPGARIEVIDGKHKGIYAVVLKMVPNSDRETQVELMMANGERLMVLKSEIELVDRTKIKNDVLEKKSTKTDGQAEGFQGGILGGADVFTKLALPEKRKSTGENSGSKRPKTDHAAADRDVFWLRPDIRVRVVCKKLSNGRLYNKKARIVDVIGHKECTIQMEDSSQIVDNVKQKSLETVLPKPGGTVMLLVGSRKGLRGKLIEKNNKKQIMQVQLFDDLTFAEYDLDDAAEYLGGSNSLAE